MEKSGIKNRGDKLSESDSSKSDLDKDDEDFLIRFDAAKCKSDNMNIDPPSDQRR